MGNSRFIAPANNRGVRFRGMDAYPKLINGTGGYAGAPARVELPSHPMDNALNRDRMTPWVTPANPDNSGSSAVYLDVDLGAARSILGFGLLGYEQANPDAATFPNIAYCGYLVSTTTYNPALFLYEWPGLQLGAGRNYQHLPAVARSARFWRYWFDAASFGDGFSLGKILLPDSVQDLGFLYSGAGWESVDPEIMTETGGQSPIVTKVGRVYRVGKLTFARVRQSAFDTLYNLWAARRPFVYIDGTGKVFEVVIDGGRLEWEHLFGPPDSFAVTLPLREIA
jgi:hypothetical protein